MKAYDITKEKEEYKEKRSRGKSLVSEVKYL
jgi:hypothetical protein